MTFLWFPDFSNYRAVRLGTPAIFSLLFLSSGCGTESARTTSTDSAADTSLVADVRPVSEESAERFAEELVETISDADPSRPIDDFFDIEAIVDAVSSDLEISMELRGQFLAAVGRSLHGPNGFLPLVRRAVTDGGSYRLLQNYEEGGRRHVLIRLIQPEHEGVDYQDYTLSQNESGKTFAIDMYVYTAGEETTSSLRRAAIDFAVNENRTLLSRISGGNSKRIEYANELLEMRTAVTNGDPAKAIQIYDAFPAELQQMKGVLILRIHAATAIEGDNGPYEEAINDFQSFFPGDPATGLLSIDYFVLTEQTTKAIEAIDSLYSRVRDPFLLAMKASYIAELGDLAAATELARKAIDNEPELDYTYLSGLTVGLLAEDNEMVGECLSTLAENFGYEFTDLATAEGYEGFVKSPEYEAFRQKHQ